MADLPPDRAEIGPPFINVGFDVFGPWTVQTRRNRGGVALNKRWGVVFTCLVSRAIHIELLETMDASSFICALRRFFSIRGPALRLRCDRGSNFVGAKTELDESSAEMDKQAVEKYLNEQGCEWQFNPPHASHFCGVWERQIGTIRRILDAMLLETRAQKLTQELLVTQMSEVTAIVNSRSITAIPTDTDEPLPLTPSMLLTQKTRPPRQVRVTVRLCSPEMEKGTIPGGPVLDEVETRIHPELTTEDEVEPGAPQSSDRRHRDDERRASPQQQLPMGEGSSCEQK